MFTNILFCISEYSIDLLCLISIMTNTLSRFFCKGCKQIVAAHESCFTRLEDLMPHFITKKKKKNNFLVSGNFDFCILN